MSNKISDSEKTILEGRIYPAIQNCVSNRYKIIVGYFAIVGFLLTEEERLAVFSNSGAILFITIVFTVFTLHNSINYWLNAKEQGKLEQNEDKSPIVEVLFGIVMTILIWGGYCLLKLQVKAA